MSNEIHRKTQSYKHTINTTVQILLTVHHNRLQVRNDTQYL